MTISRYQSGLALAVERNIEHTELLYLLHVVFTIYSDEFTQILVLIINFAYI